MTIENCYTVLGIDENTSLEDVKKAYRKKAKELHPDRNKDKNAHTNFIELKNIYDYVLNYKDPTVFKSNSAHTTPEEPKYQSKEEFYKENLRRRVKLAREKAKAAKEAYQKTDKYKNEQAFLIVFKHFRLFSSMIILCTPFLAYFNYGLKGLYTGLLISFFTSPYWVPVFSKSQKVKVKPLTIALKRIYKIHEVQYVFWSFVNLFLFFTYPLNSNVNVYLFILTILTTYSIVALLFFVKKEKNKSLKRKTYSILIPLFFNLFFLINATFSKKTFTETYRFKHHKENEIHTDQEATTFIYLENNAYEYSPWLRSFYDFESMENKTKITYQFKEGLFGLKTLEKFDFKY